MLEDLKRGKSLSVIGKERWPTFQTMANFFSITPDQLSLIAGNGKAAEVACPMVKVRLVSKLERGYYLESPGRRNLGASERVSVTRVTEQLGFLTPKKSSQSRRQRRPRARNRKPGIWHRNRNLPHQHGSIPVGGRIVR